MLRRDVVVRALAPPRIDRQLQRPRPGPGPGQPPAEAVVAPRIRQAEPDLRRHREPAAEGRDPVAEPRLQALPPGAVVVRRKPFKGGARQQRVLAVRRPRPEALAQRQRRTAVVPAMQCKPAVKAAA